MWGGVFNFLEQILNPHSPCQQAQGQNQPVEAMFTLPVDYMRDDKVRLTNAPTPPHALHTLSFQWPHNLRCTRAHPHVAQVKEVGVLLAHGEQDWRGQLMTELAAALAAEGECQRGAWWWQWLRWWGFFPRGSVALQTEAAEGFK